jgi:hypothetical protein
MLRVVTQSIRLILYNLVYPVVLYLPLYPILVTNDAFASSRLLHNMHDFICQQVERDCGTRWFTTWGSIRHRAKEVLEKKLGEEEQDLDVPEIVIPEDDDQDPYAGIDDV